MVEPIVNLNTEKSLYPSVIYGEINNIYRCLTAMVEKRHPEKTSRYQEMTLLTFSFLIFVSTSLTLDWKLACAFDHYSTFIVQPCMVDVNKELFFFPYFLSAPMSAILSTSMLATMSAPMSAILSTFMLATMSTSMSATM